LEKISENLDLSSLKCYKKSGKSNVSKFKIQKNDKSNMYKVQNYDSGKTVSGSDFKKFITINWQIIFCVIPVRILR